MVVEFTKDGHQKNEFPWKFVRPFGFSFDLEFGYVILLVENIRHSLFLLVLLGCVKCSSGTLYCSLYCFSSLYSLFIFSLAL